MPDLIERQPNGEYRLDCELWLPRPPEEVFPFFADAHNLQELTPDWMHFHVVTPRPIVMRAGTLIDYRLRVRLLPIRWRTRIEEWQPPERFIDAQLKGPYRLWRHTHEFEPSCGGTLCRDFVRYRPLGGRFTNALFVQCDVERIFAYRRVRLQEMFGEGAGTG